MIRKRILQYIDYKNITRYRFYKDMQLSNGFLDKEGSVRSDICEKICYQYPDLNLYWLITGKGTMLNHHDHLTTETIVNFIISNKKELMEDDLFIQFIDTIAAERVLEKEKTKLDQLTEQIKQDLIDKIKKIEG
ncbi:hypothetical protein UJ101_01210 [Flavobacteriaceae bacterium UJ101]|nr:hypothetical protein UJ101_01210 [Flavobacteriaceae bacterium UJ101]